MSKFLYIPFCLLFPLISCSQPDSYSGRLNIAFKDSLTGERLDSVKVTLYKKSHGKEKFPPKTVLVKRKLKYRISGEYMWEMKLERKGYLTQVHDCINCPGGISQQRIIYLKRKPGVKLVPVIE